jgi:hypothetical protein
VPVQGLTVRADFSGLFKTLLQLQAALARAINCRNINNRI